MGGLSTSTLSCLIVDDEEAAHTIIRHYISQIPWLTWLGSCYNAVQAMDMIARYSPSIIFLDVRMPGISGLSLLQMAGPLQSSVVLTTAHRDYAPEGYEYDVASFLLKPITIESFLKAVNKIRRKISRLPTPLADTEPEQNVAEIITQPDIGDAAALFDNPQIHAHFAGRIMWVRSEKELHPLRYEDITHIEASRNYTAVHAGSQKLLVRVPISELNRNLPTSLFIRTHRSFIVNVKAIEKIEGNQIFLHNDYRVGISSHARRMVLRRLASWDG